LAQQNFTAIETDTINPIGRTLTIGSGEDHNIEIATRSGRTAVLHLGDGNDTEGDVLINSGEEAEGNVQILNGLGSTGQITLGVAGTSISLGCPITPVHQYPVISSATGYKPGGIGYINFATVTNNNFGPGTSGSGVSMRSVSLTPGVWFLTGRVTFQTATNLVNTNNNFSTQLNNIGGQFARKGTSAIGTLGTLPVNARATSTSAFVRVTSTTTYYYNICNATSGGVIACNFISVRIA
jgi:hypothetical protein